MDNQKPPVLRRGFLLSYARNPLCGVGILPKTVPEFKGQCL
ncbi:hypothetical protein [Campylobacter troglodytis]|nr:hypothetical protein [Campylobacter troglodytis]